MRIMSSLLPYRIEVLAPSHPQENYLIGESHV